HLKGLSHVRQLDLFETRLGDAGLAHFHGFTELIWIDLGHTRVSDRGVLALKRALPRAQIILDDDLVDQKTRTLAEADPAFARTLPVRQAIAVLIEQARHQAMRGDFARSAASLDVFCSLEPDTILGLVKLA